jgi:hypothetical protein
MGSLALLHLDPPSCQVLLVGGGRKGGGRGEEREKGEREGGRDGGRKEERRGRGEEGGREKDLHYLLRLGVTSFSPFVRWSPGTSRSAPLGLPEYFILLEQEEESSRNCQEALRMLGSGS